MASKYDFFWRDMIEPFKQILKEAYQYAPKNFRTDGLEGFQGSVLKKILFNLLILK